MGGLISFIKKREKEKGKENSLPATSLNLHLGETVLPDGHIRSHAVLAVVEEDDHAVGVHALAGIEFVVFEASEDLLGKGARLGLEVLDLLFGLALALELFLYGLHVACL